MQQVNCPKCAVRHPHFVWVSCYVLFLFSCKRPTHTLLRCLRDRTDAQNTSSWILISCPTFQWQTRTETQIQLNLFWALIPANGTNKRPAYSSIHAIGAWIFFEGFLLNCAFSKSSKTSHVERLSRQRLITVPHLFGIHIQFYCLNIKVVCPSVEAWLETPQEDIQVWSLKFAWKLLILCVILFPWPGWAQLSLLSLVVENWALMGVSSWVSLQLKPQNCFDWRRWAALRAAVSSELTVFGLKVEG